jgi:hypothetical protein
MSKFRSTHAQQQNDGAVATATIVSGALLAGRFGVTEKTMRKLAKRGAVIERVIAGLDLPTRLVAGVRLDGLGLGRSSSVYRKGIEPPVHLSPRD